MYWCHITKFSFHVFWVDIDLISKILKILLDGLDHFPARVFSKIDKSLEFPNFESYRILFFFYVRGCFLSFLAILVSPKIKVVGFGKKGHFQKSLNHRNEEFEVLPSANREVLSSK